jgi:predicted O-methyltransferase YrrM
MPNPELRRRLDSLPGWLSYEEGEALYDLARACTGRGVIVEIGSWKGKSTTCLGLGSRAGAGVRIFAVDRHTDGTFPEWEKHVVEAGIEDLVTPLKGRSQDVVHDFHEEIELLFIDGAHTYDLVLEDWDGWVPKVVPGGVVAMHDTTGFPGVKRVAEEHLFKSRDFRGVRFVYPTTSLGTKAPASTLDLVRNRFALGVMRTVAGALHWKRLVPHPLQQAGRRILRAIQ